MKEPYKIHFQSEVHSKINVNGNLPLYSLFSIAFAKAVQYTLTGASILHQYFSSFLFYIELYEIDAKEDFMASFEIAKKQLFLFFMLEGGISFSCEKNEPIIDIKGGEFCASYKQKGHYRTAYKTGMHRFLVISYRVKWLKWVIRDYPHLDELHQSFQEGTEPYKVMPLVKINKPVSTLLQRLYSHAKTETLGELGGLIKAFVSKILMRYNTMLEDEYSKVSYRAKNYLDENYHNPDLDIDHLVDILYTTEQTLRENFKKDYGKTPMAYLLEIRMQRAHHLLENESFSLEKVAKMVGYEDTPNFSRQFKKTFDYPPSDARKR